MINHLSQTQKGMLFAFTGYTMFAFSDASVKWLSEQGYSLYQIIAVDTAIGAALMLLCAPFLGGLASLKDRKNAKAHGARIVLNTIINLLVLYCFSVMPLANAYTGIFTLPFTAAIIGMLLFGEKIGIHRWVSIVVGFSGVLIAFQPWQADANLMFMALPVISTIFIALMFMAARYLKDCSLLAMGFYPVIGTCLLLTPLAVIDWQAIDLAHLHGFIICGILMSSGIIFVSLAFQAADSAAVTPIVYTEIIWGILFGALLFSDLPDLWMIVGAVVIIVSGLYLIRSERTGR